MLPHTVCYQQPPLCCSACKLPCRQYILSSIYFLEIDYSSQKRERFKFAFTPSAVVLEKKLIVCMNMFHWVHVKWYSLLLVCYCYYSFFVFFISISFAIVLCIRNLSAFGPAISHTDQCKTCIRYQYQCFYTIYMNIIYYTPLVKSLETLKFF